MERTVTVDGCACFNIGGGSVVVVAVVDGFSAGVSVDRTAASDEADHFSINASVVGLGPDYNSGPVSESGTDSDFEADSGN